MDAVEPYIIRYTPWRYGDASWTASRGEHHAIGDTPSAALKLLELYLLEVKSRQRDGVEPA